MCWILSLVWICSKTMYVRMLNKFHRRLSRLEIFFDLHSTAVISVKRLHAIKTDKT